MSYLESFQRTLEYGQMVVEAVALERREKTEPIGQLRNRFREAYHEHTPSGAASRELNWKGYPDEPSAWFLFLDDVKEHAARVEWVLEHPAICEERLDEPAVIRSDGTWSKKSDHSEKEWPDIERFIRWPNDPIDIVLRQGSTLSKIKGFLDCWPISTEDKAEIIEGLFS